MQVGDILTRDAVNDELPVGGIVRHQLGVGATVLVKAEYGFHWCNSGSSNPAFEEQVYARGPWTVAYLPEPPAPKVPVVGETIKTKEQAALLPVGTMIYDDAAGHGAYEITNGAGERPAVKVGPNRWMWHSAGGVNAAVFDGDEIVVCQPHRVVFIPDVAA